MISLKKRRREKDRKRDIPSKLNSGHPYSLSPLGSLANATQAPRKSSIQAIPGLQEGITLHVLADFNFPGGRRDRRYIIGPKNHRYLS
jgi:hypothetical protein